MSARSRCPACGHPRKRIVTATSKTGKPPHVHKTPCGCPCHRRKDGDA